MSEVLDVIKKDGKVIDKKSREVVHEKHLLHKQVMIFVFNSSGDVLVQKRSKKKEIFPNYWSIGVTGHVLSGEDERSAAVREAKEELSMIIKQSHLINIGSFVIDVPEEYAKIKMYYYEYNAELERNKKEVADFKYIPINKVSKIKKLTPLSKKALEFYKNEMY